MISKDKIMETMLELVAVPGISGTKSESLTAEKLYELLQGIEYFKNNPDLLVIKKIEGDLLGRSFVSALYRSKRKVNRTLILTGHIDVVGVEEFGHLKDYAFNPIEFTKRVKELKLDEDTIRDLESGDWLFGRGVADMKFGIALCCELLRELSEKNDFDGNILFLGVPAEETNSEGMLGAASHLVELKEKLDLDYSGLLLPECYIQKSPSDKTRYIHIGACGKVMPLFFFSGKETHVCEPFAGINPNLLASEVNRLFEQNVSFCEKSGDAVTPTPICLKQTDLKDLYSVQTPIYAASYYNLITLNASIEDIIKRLRDLATEAFNNAAEIFEKNRKNYEAISGMKSEEFEMKPCVMTYEELLSEVKKTDSSFESELEGKIRRWAEEGIENQTIAINIIKETYERYPNKVPAIIVAFAPPYYPDRYPDMEEENNKIFMDTIDKIIAYAKDKYGEPIQKRNYYMGICDLSYTGLSDTRGIDEISSNMPGVGVNYMLPVEALKKLNITGIVLGAYGKDMHKYSERLNISYSFDVLPDLYEKFIYTLFSK